MLPAVLVAGARRSHGADFTSMCIRQLAEANKIVLCCNLGEHDSDVVSPLRIKNRSVEKGSKTERASRSCPCSIIRPTVPISFSCASIGASIDFPGTFTTRTQCRHAKMRKPAGAKEKRRGPMRRYRRSLATKRIGRRQRGASMGDSSGGSERSFSWC